MISFKPLESQEFEGFFNSIVLDHANQMFKSSGQELGFCYGYSKSKIDELFNQKIDGVDHFTMNIFDNEVVIGYLWYALQQFPEKITSTLYYIYLKKEFRNKHYGKQVMNLFELEMKSYNVHEIRLFVFAGNGIARNLYNDLGYFVVGFDMKKNL